LRAPPGQLVAVAVDRVRAFSPASAEGGRAGGGCAARVPVRHAAGGWTAAAARGGAFGSFVRSRELAVDVTPRASRAVRGRAAPSRVDLARSLPPPRVRLDRL